MEPILKVDTVELTAERIHKEFEQSIALKKYLVEQRNTGLNRMNPSGMTLLVRKYGKKMSEALENYYTEAFGIKIILEK